MTRVHTENPLYKLLEHRVPADHLQQRLRIEQAREKRLQGKGIKFFHVDSWFSVHSLIRNTLRLGMLHQRGKQNALDLKVELNDIAIRGLPAEFHDFRIAHISDLHIDINDSIPRVLKETLLQLDYDICVITGDLRAKTYGSVNAAMSAIKGVRDSIKKPVYAVLGNHDSIQMVPALEGMDIRVLLNEAVTIERNGASISLAGIDDPHYYETHSIKKAAQEIPMDHTSVLLSHSPETYEDAAQAGFDAFLCGHTHGGQICLPGGVALMKNARCPRAFCNGAWEHNGMKGYTSRGSGASVVDVRFNCPPEVTLHQLKSISA